MKESKPYPRIDEEDGNMLTASEPVAATAMATEYALPEDVDYANIVDGTLQVTSDIEDEIAEVERGEVVSMSEFKTMFAKWLDYHKRDCPFCALSLLCAAMLPNAVLF